MSDQESAYKYIDEVAAAQQLAAAKKKLAEAKAVHEYIVAPVMREEVACSVEIARLRDAIRTESASATMPASSQALARDVLAVALLSEYLADWERRHREVAWNLSALRSRHPEAGRIQQYEEEVAAIQAEYFPAAPAAAVASVRVPNKGKKGKKGRKA